MNLILKLLFRKTFSYKQQFSVVHVHFRDMWMERGMKGQVLFLLQMLVYSIAGSGLNPICFHIASMF